MEPVDPAGERRRLLLRHRPNPSEPTAWTDPAGGARQADPELDAIRAQRMAQLAAQGGGALPAAGMGGGQAMQQAQAAEEQKAAMEEQRSAMLGAVLKPDARERLSRIALVKPERARAIEDSILQNVQRGQIREAISGKALVEMLKVSLLSPPSPAGAPGGRGLGLTERNQTQKNMEGGGEKKGSGVTFQRRNVFDDDDW